MNRRDELIQITETYSAHNYKPLPVMLTRGKKAIVQDVDGKEYLDFLACYSALNFGHGHPRLVETLKRQVDKLAVCSRAFYSEEFSLFTKSLAEFCGLESVLAMNSGAEACETAIKIARKWGYEKKGVAPGQAKIIVMANNFHGRTVTLISFSTEPGYREGFGPFTPGFEVIPFGDLSALEAAIDNHTVAVLLEPIQAEAGILIPPPGYLANVSALCRKHNILMMLDEIQTGFGRTGRDFCFQHESVKPDVLILAKSLGGGLIPLSAVVSSRAVMSVMKPGQHGSTFGGNPLACAVGREVLALMKDEKLSERSAYLGEVAMRELKKAPLPKVKEIRGMGMLIGIEMDTSTGGARKYCERLATEGVLCKETHDYVIRIAPPLVIEEADLVAGIRKVVEVIGSF